MTEIPIITKRETIERGFPTKKVEKLPVFNIEIGKPRNIYAKDATANDIPIEAITSKILKSTIFQDTVILDIRDRLRKAEKLIKDCNVNTLNAICEVDKLANIQSRYLRISQPSVFGLLIEDINNLKKSFIYNCRSILIGNIREEIEKDIKDTFRALNVPMDQKDRMELFSFYLSGLIKGYMSVFKNMNIEFEFPLIDDIMSIFRRYEKEEISSYDSWKYIQELLY